MQNVQTKLAQELARECRTVEDIHSELKELFKDTMQEILEVEMAEHLGYDKHNVEGNNTGNSRNAYFSAPSGATTAIRMKTAEATAYA